MCKTPVRRVIRVLTPFTPPRLSRTSPCRRRWHRSSTLGRGRGSALTAIKRPTLDVASSATRPRRVPPAGTEWRVEAALGQQDSPANDDDRVYEPYGHAERVVPRQVVRILRAYLDYARASTRGAVDATSSADSSTSAMERDYFMTPEEAREYGIIDRMIAHR